MDVAQVRTHGCGKFCAVAYGSENELPDDEYPFILSTGRVLYHWHGGAMTAMGLSVNDQSNRW